MWGYLLVAPLGSAQEADCKMGVERGDGRGWKRVLEWEWCLSLGRSVVYLEEDHSSLACPWLLYLLLAVHAQ